LKAKIKPPPLLRHGSAVSARTPMRVTEQHCSALRAPLSRQRRAKVVMARRPGTR